MSVFKKNMSSGSQAVEWLMFSRNLNETTVGKLYSPLPKELPESVSARLPQDLVTLYAINTRLLRVLRAFFQQVYVPKSEQTIELEKAVKSSREELSDLTDILDYLCYNSLSDEAIRLQQRHDWTYLTYSPTLEKLLILQRATQKRINLSTLGQSKAKSFLESYIAYPSNIEECDEAIVYWLTRKEKPAYLKACLEFCISGNDRDVNKDMFRRILRLKNIFHERREILIKFISDMRPKPDDRLYNDKTDITATPNSLRFLQKPAIQYLHTTLLLPDSKNVGLVVRPSLFNFSGLFSVLKSELAITLAYKELEQLLFKCVEFIAISSDYGCLEDVRYKSLCPLAFVSLFIFACKRMQSELINSATYDMAFKYLTQWKDTITQKSYDFYTLKQNGKIIAESKAVYSVAMAVHALSAIKSNLSGSFAEQTKEWLLSKQHRYGYWYDADNPIYLTVMVLDAIELLREVPDATFDAKFVLHAGKDNEDRPLKRKLSKCRRIPRSKQLAGMVTHPNVDGAQNIETLYKFMEKYCDLSGKPILDSKCEILYRRHREHKITLPKEAYKSGPKQTKYYYVDDLKENWESYEKIIPTLPPLKPSATP
jgi:hypothetical protein